MTRIVLQKAYYKLLKEIVLMCLQGKNLSKTTIGIMVRHTFYLKYMWMISKSNNRVSFLIYKFTLMLRSTSATWSCEHFEIWCNWNIPNQGIKVYSWPVKTISKNSGIVPPLSNQEDCKKIYLWSTYINFSTTFWHIGWINCSSYKEFRWFTFAISVSSSKGNQQSLLSKR